MARAPFYERDGQIRLDLPGAHLLFTTVPWGDVRQTGGEIAARLGVRIVHAHQVHGDTVLELHAPGESTSSTGCEPTPIADGDAIITTLPGVAPMVLTADCVPIVLTAPGAVGVVHAGWRGLQAGIIAKAVTRLAALAPGAELRAAVGPAAGACCYEVGADVHAAFAALGQDLCDGPRLDLHAIARRQLEQAGVATVHDVGECTICADPARLFSYRRDHGATGRQGALAWID